MPSVKSATCSKAPFTAYERAMVLILVVVIWSMSSATTAEASRRLFVIGGRKRLKL